MAFDASLSHRPRAGPPPREAEVHGHRRGGGQHDRTCRRRRRCCGGPVSIGRRPVGVREARRVEDSLPRSDRDRRPSDCGPGPGDGRSGDGCGI